MKLTPMLFFLNVSINKTICLVIMPAYYPINILQVCYPILSPVIEY